MPDVLTRVINFWSGPGAGKSTTKAGTFFLLKAAGHRAAQIEEYAMERCVEEDWTALADQRGITFEQERRQRRFRGKVDWLVTDSPLPLGILYARGDYDTMEFHEEVWDLFNAYENINIWIDRVKPYQRYARYQEEAEARDLDRRLRELVGDRIDFITPGDESAPLRVIRFLRDMYEF